MGVRGLDIVDVSGLGVVDVKGLGVVDVKGLGIVEFHAFLALCLLTSLCNSV